MPDIGVRLIAFADPIGRAEMVRHRVCAVAKSRWAKVLTEVNLAGAQQRQCNRAGAACGASATSAQSAN